MELPLRLSGAVWGRPVNDAVGVPCELAPAGLIGEVSGTYGQPSGTWSAFSGLATASACLLVDTGVSPRDAMSATRRSRKGTIETGVQVDFVRRWPGA